MSRLTDTGRAEIAGLATKYGLSPEAVEQMARAVAQGGGSMAQFNIAELGGQGQWMAGGMTMVGDMFNSGLQGTVANLCADLSASMAALVFFEAPPAPSASAAWWPTEFGQPSASGGQNQTRYAYFPAHRRIAVDMGDGSPVVVLDTQDHQIGGFGQQQSGGGDPFFGINFSSQFGTFALSSLARVGAPAQPEPAQPPQPSAPPHTAQPSPQAAQPSPQAAQPSPQAAQPLHQPSDPAPTAPGAAEPVDAAGIVDAIERLAGLRDRGVLTPAEFDAKKAELLSRL